MKILALELSSGRGSVAWRDGDKDAVGVEFASDRQHSGLFFANLRRALRELPAPERIAIGVGPGSYAGTRIAIAAALGLRAATGAALVGISSLRAMALEDGEYIAIGDARRQSFYFAHVQRRRLVEGPTLCSADELQTRLVASRLRVVAAEPLRILPDVRIAYPSALVLLELAAAEPVLASEATLEPMYLREPHITQPRVSAR